MSSPTIAVPVELLERVCRADASKGASAIDLVEGWKAMEELRTLLATQPAEPESRRYLTPADDALGAWLSASLGDPNVCEEFKQDVKNWMGQFAFPQVDSAQEQTS